MSCYTIRCAAAVAAIILLKKKEKKKKRKMWVREWILRRQELGFHHRLFKELINEDHKSVENFMRMSVDDFKVLLDLVAPKVTKKDTVLRPSISASERLLVTLRFLSTGDSYHSLSYLFRIPVCTLSRIIPECCAALFEVLKDTYLKVPKSEAEWKSHADKFEARWNFHHCIAAIDGKHITIQAPANSGSTYFNYKGAHSIVLMAMADAEYKFIYVDIGCNGRISDGGVFLNCKISKALEENSLNIPQPQFLAGVEIPMPYVIVADNAFPLKSYIMKPYPFQNLAAPNRVFNYRLSRARRIVENVFGLISNRFRVLRKPIQLCPEKVVAVVSAICALHNFLMTKRTSCERYAPIGTFDVDNEEGIITPGNWREMDLPAKSLLPLQNLNVTNYTANAKKIRDTFKDFFVSPQGEVSWQYKYI